MSIVCTASPVSTCEISSPACASLSVPDPAQIYVPSKEKDTLCMAPVALDSVRLHVHSSVSHNETSESPPPTAR